MSFTPMMNVPFVKVYSASNTVSFKVPSIESVLPISKVKLSKTITFPLSSLTVAFNKILSPTLASMVLFPKTTMDVEDANLP